MGATVKNESGLSRQPKGRNSKRPQGPRVDGGSIQARRVAAMILEALAGVRAPYEAAEMLGISGPRYYVLEQRALQGFLEACEPRPKGPVRSPEQEVQRLQKEIRRLEREVLRQQALTRATQRTVGFPAAPKGKRSGSTKKKRTRKPVVRALKAAALLQETGPVATEEIPAGEGTG